VTQLLTIFSDGTWRTNAFFLLTSDRVDTGRLEQLGVLAADALDPHEVGMVGELHDELRRDPGGLSDFTAALPVAAVLEKSIGASDAGLLELGG
jgi:hypothetical protein